MSWEFDALYNREPAVRRLTDPPPALAKLTRSQIIDFLRADVEREQALIRGILVLLTGLYLYIAHPEFFFSLSPRLIVLAYLPLSIALIFRVVYKPGAYRPRKIAFTILDQAAIATVLYSAGNTVPVIALAFWVMVGSGFRFGKAYLYLSEWTAVAGLFFCIFFSPHWAGHTVYGWGFIASIVTVAFYTDVLLARVSETNRQLSGSLNRVSALARNDSLTGLPNRRALVERLTQSIAMAQRTRLQVSLLYCDLDGFKAVNDTFGHNSGDEVLKQVAQRLTAIIRRTDMLARFGGDEFIIVLEGTRIPQNAPRVARMVLDSVQEIEVGGVDRLPGTPTSLRIGASVGIALYDPATTPTPPSVEEFIKQADDAMYSAKKAGKCCYRFSPVHIAAAPVSDDRHDHSDEHLRVDEPKGPRRPDA